jgi:hypothetical protein
MCYVELLRHPDNDGDLLSPDGVTAAEEFGRTSLHPPYAFFASTGAARAVQKGEGVLVTETDGVVEVAPLTR